MHNISYMPQYEHAKEAKGQAIEQDGGGAAYAVLCDLSSPPVATLPGPLIM